MQTKTFLLSAILALSTASLASEYEHKDRRQNDNFGSVPHKPRTNVASPISVQKLLAVPQMAAQLAKKEAEPEAIFTLSSRIDQETIQVRQAGGGSPFDNDLDVSSPAKLELKDHDEYHIVARAPSKISEVIESAIPADVKKALINDPKAAESLAKEFSGKSVPQWYAKLPASVTNYYSTITTPPTMTGYVSKGPAQDKVDDWISNVQSYSARLASQISAMSSVAASESREAKRLSKEASSRSSWATHHSDKQVQTSAWSEAKKAATMSYAASSLSSYAASASRAVFSPHKDDKKTSQGASTTDMTLALGSSIVGAVLCLGFAIAL
jgi:hypothetical protein